MKLSFELDQILYDEIEKSAKDNGRSDSGEIRFQLKKIYEANKK
jgi:hypothetical protein